MHVVLCLAFLTNVQPTTGYYDAAMGYQTAGPATSLGGGRGDALPGVQGVQGVQGAYTSINEPRFARNDSNASPVPSTISQQVNIQFWFCNKMKVYYAQTNVFFNNFVDCDRASGANDKSHISRIRVHLQ